MKLFVFKNIFEFLSFANFFKTTFRSTCRSVAVNTGHNSAAVNYKLISITVWASNICVFSLVVLLQRDFFKYLRFSIFYKIFVFFLIYNNNRWTHWHWNFAQLNIEYWHISIASYGDINEHFRDFSWYLRILITVKVIVFKNRNEFLNFAPLCSFLSTCWPIAMTTGPISFLLNFRLNYFI